MCVRVIFHLFLSKEIYVKMNSKKEQYEKNKKTVKSDNPNKFSS
jgi:hypothetical protein